jgi:hypothetical protein
MNNQLDESMSRGTMCRHWKIRIIASLTHHSISYFCLKSELYHHIWISKHILNSISCFLSYPHTYPRRPPDIFVPHFTSNICLFPTTDNVMAIRIIIISKNGCCNLFTTVDHLGVIARFFALDFKNAKPQ